MTFSTFEVEPLSGPEFGNTLVSLRSVRVPQERGRQPPPFHHLAVSKAVYLCHHHPYRWRDTFAIIHYIDLYRWFVSITQHSSAEIPWGCTHLELAEYQVSLRKHRRSALHGHSKRGENFVGRESKIPKGSMGWEDLPQAYRFPLWISGHFSPKSCR